VIDPAGNDVYDFYPSYYGYGESTPLLLSAGNYRLRVTYNYDYEAEYRFRITLVPSASYQVESENNDSVGNANSPTFTLSNIAGTNHVQTSIAGAVVTGDGGDFYYLGNLIGGTQINLSESQPGTSSLSDILAVVNSAGTVVASSAAGAASLSYTIPAGSDGKYYVRMTANGSTAGLLSQYILGIDMVDAVAPKITVNTLPAQGERPPPSSIVLR
jgi:hypothetical protein